MNTFFDKLTNTNQSTTMPHDDTIEEELTDIPTKKPEASPRQLKVSPEEAAEIAAETQEEEEGELTVDIYDHSGNIVIQSTVAGVRPEHLDVSITDDTVSIRGRRDQHERVGDDNYYYKELFWGSFARSVILPEEIDHEAAEATLKHGLLTIKLPKKRRGVKQKLKIKLN